MLRFRVDSQKTLISMDSVSYLALGMAPPQGLDLTHSGKAISRCFIVEAMGKVELSWKVSKKEGPYLGP